MTRRRKLELLADPVLHPLDLGSKELHGVSTYRTNHVMVAAAVQTVFEAGDAVVEFDLRGETALREELQRAINGGVADGRIALSNQVVQFFGGEMVVGSEKDAQDRIALSTVFEPEASYMFTQNAVGIIDQFPRTA